VRSAMPRLTLALLAALPPGALAGQQWNDSATVALIRRGIAVRRLAEPDSTLRSYRAQAHGFVFFLGQAGHDLLQPPRLIKADELQVDIYWQAPGVSRQVIRAWRDGRWLPTDITYHRDHLGIVTNNFGDRIRIGEGDEVKDVVHPLAAQGLALYDFRLRDSVRLRVRDTVLELDEIEVRPRDLNAPRVVGTLSLDRATGDLVRFRFSFTPAAYLDPSVEDISIVVDNARVEQRWWLPWRQEVEIRRRVTWLDFPARSIIRGRWEIDDYDLNVAIPPEVIAGPAIGGLQQPVDTGGSWPEPLAEAVRGVARPVEREDLEEVRQEIDRIAEGRLSALPGARLGFSSISDIAHVNRVQGLALGAGLALRVLPHVVLRPRAAFGTSDSRLLGDLRLSWERPQGTVTLGAGRRLADLGDTPIISGLTNSLLSQEGGRDYGDYVLLDQARLTVEQQVGSGASVTAEGGVDRSRSVSTEATPASGHYAPNPALGAGTIGMGRLGFDFESASLDRTAGVVAQANLEGGAGDHRYLRATLNLEVRARAGIGGLQLRAQAGAGTDDLPAYRSFAIGGWGTLPGEPFRAWGGRQMVLGELEYRLDVPFPEIPLGPFVSTGPRMTLAPFLAAGWTRGGLSGVPWVPSGTVRPVAGLGLEWFHHLIRARAGVSLRTGTLGITLDLNREWWGIL